MTKRSAQCVSRLVLLLTALSVVGFARFNSAAQESVEQANFAGDAAIKDLANYRQWHRVNEMPLFTKNFLIDGGG